MTTERPNNRSDKHAWDRWHTAELAAGRTSDLPETLVLRFLAFVHERGGRVWFPGCGLDPYPRAYAARGCRVLATDFSSVAVEYQRGEAAALLRELGPAAGGGALEVAEGDFVAAAPAGTFDVVINSRAFQGKLPEDMRAAARTFRATLRVGGACILDTINVQGESRSMIESSLEAEGFYLPFGKSERWYREQLDATGVPYLMILGRPHVRPGRTPAERLAETRGHQVLASLRGEYERRRALEEGEVEVMLARKDTLVAHVVYATG
jgi:SAM-dependent methyltransferase